MLRNDAIRRGVSAFALVALLTPGPSLAQTSTLPGADGSQTDSLVGAFMGVACGAGIGVARRAPLPIVVTVTAVACALMMLDAILSVDPN